MKKGSDKTGYHILFYSIQRLNGYVRDKMEDIILFFEKIISKLKSNKLTDDELDMIFEFYTQYEMRSEPSPRSSDEMRRYLFLGWYVDSLIN